MSPPRGTVYVDNEINAGLSSASVTFRVRHSRSEMYSGHGRLCVCLCVCLSVLRRIPILLYGPGCNLWEW